MQICSWSATEIIYSTKAIRRSNAAVWKGGCETHDKCQSAWESASNAVRIMINTLKQKQIPPKLAEAAEQIESLREKWKHMISWSVHIGADWIYRQDAAENVIMWSLLMTTNDEKDEGLIAQISDVEHQLHGKTH